MKVCRKCLMPETQEKLTFNEKGICSLCTTAKRKVEIDWNSREKKLLEILDKYRGKERYDCLIPYSGGKDSSFQVYTMVKKYKMKPLLYSFHHTFLTKTGLYNITICLILHKNWELNIFYILQIKILLENL